MEMKINNPLAKAFVYLLALIACVVFYFGILHTFFGITGAMYVGIENVVVTPNAQVEAKGGTSWNSAVIEITNNREQALALNFSFSENYSFLQLRNENGSIRYLIAGEVLENFTIPPKTTQQVYLHGDPSNAVFLVGRPPMDAQLKGENLTVSFTIKDVDEQHRMNTAYTSILIIAGLIILILITLKFFNKP